MGNYCSCVTRKQACVTGLSLSGVGVLYIVVFFVLHALKGNHDVQNIFFRSCYIFGFPLLAFLSMIVFLYIAYRSAENEEAEEECVTRKQACVTGWSLSGVGAVYTALVIVYELLVPGGDVWWIIGLFFPLGIPLLAFTTAIIFFCIGCCCPMDQDAEEESRPIVGAPVAAGNQ